MSRLYVLNADHSVEQMTDLAEWQTRLEIDNRVVAREAFAWPPGSTDKYIVTTEFTGQDQRDVNGRLEGSRPLLFETYVIGPKGNQWDGAKSYSSTWGEASESHDAVVSRIKS